MPPISTTPLTGTQTSLETSHPTTILPAITLRLRAVPSEARRIRWAEDVVDNEGLGRKQSKLCCIFHKSRQVGESSDEEDSDSDSSSDSNASDDAGDGGAMMAGKGKGENRRQHEHQHGDGEGNCEGHAGEGEGNGKGRARRKGRNAYEKAPKSGSGGEVKK